MIKVQRIPIMLCGGHDYHATSRQLCPIGRGDYYFPQTREWGEGEKGASEVQRVRWGEKRLPEE